MPNKKMLEDIVRELRSRRDRSIADGFFKAAEIYGALADRIELATNGGAK